MSDFVVNPEIGQVTVTFIQARRYLPMQLHSITDLRPVVLPWCRSVVVSTLALINVVNRHWARLLLGLGDCLRAGKPSGYVTSHLGLLTQPSIPSVG